MNRKIYFKILFFSILIANSSFSAEVVKLQDSHIKSDYVEIERLKSTKNIIVIEANVIKEKGYKTLEEILDDIPSINISKSGWGDIDIRGQGEDSSGKNIQVILDGAPITTLINHPLQTNYNIVPVENIKRIEIVPGGGSILYGGGSVGGIINITTDLMNLQKTKNSINLTIGNKQKDTNISLGYNFNDKFSAQISYTNLDKDLYFKNTYRKSNYFSGGVNYKITNNQNFSFKYSNLDENGQFIRNINYAKFQEEGKNYIPKEKNITIGLDKNKKKIEKVISGYSNADRKISTYNLDYTANFNPFRYNINLFYNKGHFDNSNLELTMRHKTYGVKAKLDYSYGNNSVFEGSNILFGIDYYKQLANLSYNDYKILSWKNKTYKLRPLSFKYNKKTMAFYFLNNLKYKDIEFSQGVRRDLTYWGFDKIANKNEGKGVSKRPNINYELALAYNYRDTGKIYARYERSFTSPDGLEITDDFSKQDIMPTKAKDTKYDIYEVGLRDKIGISTVVLTAFFNKTDNEMTRHYVLDPVLGFGRTSINILKTERKGIELTFLQKFGNLTLEESYAYLKGTRKYNENAKNYKNKNIDWTNAGLKKVPKHSLTLKGKYDFNDKISAHVKYKYSGKYSNFIEEDVTLKDEEKFIKSYSTVDLGLNYKNENGISVSAGVKNIFNKKYFDYVGERIYTVMPAEERTYYLGVKYSF